jgi:Na+-translocating ferredoxin:NAD+ oxidoreductase RnfD subunit/NAD-dependent dihydropyrimidine dehydrogenase PreA subunit
MSKPKDYSWMTKDKLMTYTFGALLALAVVSSVLWSTVTTPSGWNLGLTAAICAVIAVAIAVGLDVFLHKVTADSPLNIMSAAVFGLIVALSYSLGVPAMMSKEVLPLEAPQAFVFIALISVVGMVLFKKLQGLASRKFVNPAAAAKLVILFPFLYSVLLPADHATDIPTLAAAINNGEGTTFGTWLQYCFGHPSIFGPNLTLVPTHTQNEILTTMVLDKYHGWVGGASSIAVIIAGIALFVLARKYIKWRITLSYLVGTAVLAGIMAAVYGGDPVLRLAFHLLIGSSIFLAFFMATDPASTPLTYTGQIIFGVGLAVITILLQTYANFFGGSIVALVIMNLTSPALDRIGRGKPTTESKEPKLPKAKSFAPEKIKEYQCIRCGACMTVCCHKLSPILIKQAFDKMNFDAMSKLHADYCTGCGHCTYVCPARIDLRKSILQAKGMLRQQE